ncbi:MAG: hypothetical protein H6712_05920 [Myxococcales bacterium]|nr:hypothetical protein [Myxococcales bacterium]MCB9713373.1 hypothetical protein [Myxococcales bacterium]
MRRAGPDGILGLLLLLLATGCEDRVSQCNQLVERLNPHTDAMIRRVEGLARVESDPAAIDRLLEAIDAADGELAVLQLQDERLAGFALRYRRQLGDARKSAQAMRDAVRDRDAHGLNEAAKQADAFLEAQATILEELNGYCGGG